VNALAGVNSPPSKVNTPKEVTVTRTGMLFSIKLLSCNRRKIVRKNVINFHSLEEFHLIEIVNKHAMKIVVWHMHIEKVILCCFIEEHIFR